MSLKIFSFIIAVVLMSFTSKGQSVLEGHVLDQVSNQTLDHVHVINITNKIATVSDAKGEFKISATINDLLIFKIIGYASDTILVTSLKPLKHYLKTDINNLGTVNVNKKISYKEQYPQVLNKANPILLKPGRGLLFYPSAYFSKEGRQARYFKRMIKKEQTELKIDQRFNQKTITEILPLKQPELDAFIILYRPSLAFVNRADADDFKFYLINAYNQFKMLPAEKRVLTSLKLESLN